MQHHLKTQSFFVFCFIIFSTKNLYALTISEAAYNYTTSSNISENTTSGLYSNFAGTEISPRTITNSHIITTTGSSTNGYGIRATKDYNNITNAFGSEIITNGNSGRGISVFDNSNITNAGSIITYGSTAYGIHARSNSSVINSGSITTNNTSSSYGIYLSGDNSSANNLGTISTKTYGIYSDANFITIDNSGTINTNTGSSAHGIFVSAGGSSTASSSNHSTINNSKIINANANGIYTKDAYTEINNSGTITSGTSSSSYGIRNEGANSTITNDGTINSTTYAINNSGIGTIINNSGTINGGIIIGAGTLNILGGNINGVVDGSENSGDINVNADFTQSFAFQNIDFLNIATSTSLISKSAITANAISLFSNATLTIESGSSISGIIRGASEGVGTLNIATDFTSSSEIGGSSYSLANLNINSESSLTTAHNIYADNILLNGTLNFSDSDNLTIFGDVTGGTTGTLHLGVYSQIIDGNLTLNSGDSLSTSLGSKTIGNILVNQAAIIDANSKLKITPTTAQGYIVSGTQYTLVSGSSGSSINAISKENISVNGQNSNIYGLLEFSTSSTGDSLILTINRLSAANATSNKNAQNIYTTINNIGANSSGSLSDFQGYLDSNGFTGEELNKALRQVSPQSTKANLAAISNLANNSLNPLEGRLHKLRHHEKNGFWVQGLGSSSTQNDVNDDFGYKIISTGVAIGADKEILQDATIGAALSYSRSDVKSLDKLQKNLISSNQLSIYRSDNFADYFIDSFAGFAWNIFSSTRSITALEKNAAARFSGQSYIAKIKAGKIFTIKNGFSITPDFSLNLLHNKIASYSEKGADELNLKVSAISANSLETRAGINFGWIGKIKDISEFELFSTTLKFSYGRALINDKPTTKSNFSGQDTGFENKISHLDNKSLKAGIEIAAYHKEATTFSSNYEFEKRPNYNSHLLLFKIRQEF